MNEQEVFDALKYRISIDYLGNKRYFNKSGQLHRLGGPAVVYADGIKCWWQNGQRHRTDGPAIERVNGGNEWYINGKELTKAEFNLAVKDYV